MDPVSPSGSIIVVDNPNIDIIEQSDTANIQSIVLNVRLEDNSDQLGGDVQICIEPIQSNSNSDDLCLGYLDESLNPPEWKCEDNCLDENSNGLYCGNTNHFTNFALLLAGGSNNGCNGNSSDFWITKSSWGDFALLLTCALFCIVFSVIIVLGTQFITPIKRFMYGEEGMRISISRSNARSAAAASRFSP